MLSCLASSCPLLKLMLVARSLRVTPPCLDVCSNFRQKPCFYMLLLMCTGRMLPRQSNVDSSFICLGVKYNELLTWINPFGPNVAFANFMWDQSERLSMAWA